MIMSENIFASSEELDDLYQEEEEFTEEEAKPSSNDFVSKSGYYHVLVQGKKAESPDERGINSAVRLDLKVLGGDHEDQIDSILFHHVRLFSVIRDENTKDPIGHKPYDRIYMKCAVQVAAALGIIPRGAGVKFSQIPWNNVDDCQAIVRVDETKPDKDKPDQKPRHEVKFGNFWHISDEEVEHVPKDTEMLAYALAGSSDINDDDLDDI